MGVAQQHRIALDLERLRTDPWSELSRLQQAEGAVVAAQAGVSRIAYLKSPAAIRELLVRQHDRLAKVNTIPLVPEELEEVGTSGQGRLLMSRDRNEHLAIRKPLARDFHGALSDDVAAVAAELATAAFDASRGGDIDAGALAGRLAVEVVGRTLFADAPFDPEAASRDIMTLLGGERLFRDPQVQPSPDVAVTVPRLLDAFERLVHAHAPVPRIVADMAAALDVDAADAGRTLLAIYAAGTETTAPAMTFALAHLGASPQLQEWLREESDAVLAGEPLAAEHLGRLSRARSVVAETLRLYPPSWFIARVADEPTEVEGYTLERGEIAVVCVYLLQRDGAVFEAPDEFRPERFLDARPPAVYIPFGMGRRQCIGEPLAWIEATMVVAAASRHALELLGDMPLPLPHASIHPDRPVRLRSDGSLR